jgi:hypothetical protein
MRHLRSQLSGSRIVTDYDWSLNDSCLAELLLDDVLDLAQM